MSDKKDLIKRIISEASSYKSLDDIEKLIEVGKDLSAIPVQPLYAALTSTSSDQVAQIIPKLSAKQKQTMLDLDLWHKDHIDVESFEFWIESYSKVKEIEITQEFVNSEDFFIYLKGRVNLYTFDVEDPQYPDHDYYFLTDDNLLLVEYSEEFKYPNELKYFIRCLYDKLGVENAYTTLFKLMNDSFMTLEEDLYQKKKSRVEDYGFVDYFDALEKLAVFISHKQIDNFIESKMSLTPELGPEALNQTLNPQALVSFNQLDDSLSAELNKIEDDSRLSYLNFSFVKLINSTMTLKNAFRSSQIELTQIGNQTKSYLSLAVSKINSIKRQEDKSLFDTFDFMDVYRIGRSLVELEKKRIKKALAKSDFEKEDYEYFLGAWWNSFLENSFLDIPKVKAFGAGLETKLVVSNEVFEFWKEQSILFKSSMPFIQKFFESFQVLQKEGKLHDDFYLNYTVDNIDFEAIIISSYMNFALGNFSGTDVNKMGVTVSELKLFFQKYFVKVNEEYFLKPLDDENHLKDISLFCEKFGFSTIQNFNFYLYGILTEHLSGYEFDSLDDEDFKHIGGPILLNITSN